MLYLFTVNYLRRRGLLPLLLLPCAVLSMADEHVAPEVLAGQQHDSVQNGYLRRSFDWLVEQRNDWSQGFNGMASSIDGFLAGKDAEIQVNESYIRLRIGSRWIEGESVLDDSDIKLRLDLPNAEKKWDLFVENRLDELESLSNSNRDNLVAENDNDDHGFYGGISRRRNWRQWELRPELGVKVRMPLDPFARFRVSRPFDLPGVWSGRFLQSLYYFNRDGFGAKGRLFFERPVSNSRFFRIRTSWRWQDESDNTDLAQTLIMQKTIDTRRALSYELGALGVSRPSVKTSAYFFSVRYRRRLHEDWLFLDVVPDVSWPREQNFESIYSLTLRLEVLFAD